MWYNNGSIKIQAKRCRIMANRINYQLEMEKVLRTAGGIQTHAAAACLLRALLQRHAGTAGRAFPALPFYIITPTSTRPPNITAARPSWSALWSRRAIATRSSSCPMNPHEFYTAVQGLRAGAGERRALHRLLPPAAGADRPVCRRPWVRVVLHHTVHLAHERPHPHQRPGARNWARNTTCAFCPASSAKRTATSAVCN